MDITLQWALVSLFIINIYLSEFTWMTTDAMPEFCRYRRGRYEGCSISEVHWVITVEESFIASLSVGNLFSTSIIFQHNR